MTKSHTAPSNRQQVNLTQIRRIHRDVRRQYGITAKAFVQESVTGEYALDIAFRNQVGERVTLRLPSALFVGQQSEVLKLLKARLFPVPDDPDDRTKLFNALKAARPKRVIR